MSLWPKRQLAFASFIPKMPPLEHPSVRVPLYPTRFFTVTPGAKAFRACTQCSNARGWAVASGHLLQGRETSVGAEWPLGPALSVYVGVFVLGGRWLVAPGRLSQYPQLVI